MSKVLANLLGVALACLGAHQLTGTTDWKALLTGIGVCIAANQAGLWQEKPSMKE